MLAENSVDGPEGLEWGSRHDRGCVLENSPQPVPFLLPMRQPLLRAPGPPGVLWGVHIIPPLLVAPLPHPSGRTVAGVIFQNLTSYHLVT